MTRLRHLLYFFIGEPVITTSTPTHAHDLSVTEFRALRRAESAEKDIEIYRDALRPFARMHREGGDPNELLLQRGKGKPVTFLRAGDFDRAFYLLDDHNV